jgi:hypothetical protein
VTIGGSGCSGSPEATCDELRTELASIEVTASDAWDDITVLRGHVERELELWRTIERRCPASD